MNAETSEASTTTRVPEPLGAVPMGAGASGAAARSIDRLRYKVTNGIGRYADALAHVTVDDVTVSAEEAEKWAKLTDAHDAVCEREAPAYGKPDWHGVPEGTTFKIAWRRIRADLTTDCLTTDCVEWSCSVRLAPDEYPTDYGCQRLLGVDQEGATLFARHVYGCDSWGLSHALEGALLAHLQANASKFFTPGDAEVCVGAFLDAVKAEVAEIMRAEYAPDMVGLVLGAVHAARPTPTGIDALDSVLGGGLVPGVYVIAGDPGAGKTALAVQLLMYAAHVCGEGERVAYAMLDQGGASEIAKRLVSLAWAIDAEQKGEQATKGMLSDAARWSDVEASLGAAACEEITGNRMVLIDLMDGSTMRLTAHLERLINAGHVSMRLLVVDYYQLLSDAGDPESEGVTVATDPAFASATISRLRTWATRNGVPILLVGQFTKEAIERHSKGVAPKMTDLLGSVDVPYQAEAVLTLTNAHDGSGVVEIADTKHRHAGNESQEGRRARLVLDGEHGYFSEPG